jgi:CRP/FNR family transcriptional regulator, cyclic AMP receptor protein
LAGGGTRPAASCTAIDRENPPMEQPAIRIPIPLVESDWEALTSLPLIICEPGQIVLSAGLKTGRLLILKRGAVVVLKDSVEIAKVDEPGAVFGEISALLDQPHAADVRAVKYSEFYVANAMLLRNDPIALLYVARVIAARLVAADSSLVEAKKQSQSGRPPTLDELLRQLNEIYAKLP